MRHKSRTESKLPLVEHLSIIGRNTETRFTPPDDDSKSTYPMNLVLAAHEGRVSREYISKVIEKIESIVKFMAKGTVTDDLTSIFFWLKVVNEPGFYERIDKIGRYLFDNKKNPPLFSRFGQTEPQLSSIDSVGDGIVAPVVITDSHRNDHLILDSVLKSENLDPSKVGVVVLDRHIDTLSAGGIDDIRTRASAVNAFLHKGIKQVAVVGMPEDDRGILTKESAINGANEVKLQILDAVRKLTGSVDNGFDEIISNYTTLIGLLQLNSPIPNEHLWMTNENFVRLVGVYLNYISLTRDDIKVHANTSDFSAAETARKIVDDFKSAGVGCFVLSVDFDVLDLWYEEITTTMYSPFAVLGLLSNMNIDKLESMINDIRKLNNRQAKEFLAKKAVIQIAELMQNISQPELMRSEYYEIITYLTADPFISEERNPLLPKEHITSFDGMKIEQIRELIRELKKQAAAQGVQFGIQRGNGTPFFGTLTELAYEYPDYMGKTVAAIANITKEIIS